LGPGTGSPGTCGTRPGGVAFLAKGGRKGRHLVRDGEDYSRPRRPKRRASWSGGADRGRRIPVRRAGIEPARVSRRDGSAAAQPARADSSSAAGPARRTRPPGGSAGQPAGGSLSWHPEPFRSAIRFGCFSPRAPPATQGIGHSTGGVRLASTLKAMSLSLDLGNRLKRFSGTLARAGCVWNYLSPPARRARIVCIRRKEKRRNARGGKRVAGRRDSKRTVTTEDEEAKERTHKNQQTYPCDACDHRQALEPARYHDLFRAAVRWGSSRDPRALPGEHQNAYLWCTDQVDDGLATTRTPGAGPTS